MIAALFAQQEAIIAQQNADAMAAIVAQAAAAEVAAAQAAEQEAIIAQQEADALAIITAQQEADAAQAAALIIAQQEATALAIIATRKEAEAWSKILPIISTTGDIAIATTAVGVGDITIATAVNAETVDLGYTTNDDGTITTNPFAGDFSTGVVTNAPCVDGLSHLNILTGERSQWPGNDTIQFGACGDSFAMTIAINSVLAVSGISIDKLHYSWKWINGCFNVTKADGSTIQCDTDIENRLDENFKATGEYADQLDTLTIEVKLTDSMGNIIETKTYDYDTWYHWYNENAHSLNEVSENNAIWQIEEDHIELFNNVTGAGTIYSPNQLGNISFITTAKDNGLSPGYYGPVIRNGQMWFTYRDNPCLVDTLFNSGCDGYAEAYATYMYNQNCTASALYDMGCPGYAVAFYNQQCTISPLYDQGCAGYYDAYLTQQCDLDTLYDASCPGYKVAYLSQQCELDSLYSMECPMYQISYFNQQCDLDGQFDMACPNYISISEESITDPIANIISVPNLPVAPPIIDIIIIPTTIPPIEIPVQIVIPEIVAAAEPEITTASLEAELEEIITDEPGPESTTESADTDEPDSESGDAGDSGSESEPETEEPAKQEDEEQPESESDGESEEESSDDTESEDDTGTEEDTGEDTSTEDGDGKDEKEEPEPVEEPTEAEKKKSKKKKIKQLIADKIKSITDKAGEATTIEEQMETQAQLVALIAFVPDFNYGDLEVPDGYTYPPQQPVDNAFSRWFVNDPNFGIMEDMQYPNLRQ